MPEDFEDAICRATGRPTKAEVETEVAKKAAELKARADEEPARQATLKGFRDVFEVRLTEVAGQVRPFTKGSAFEFLRQQLLT